MQSSSCARTRASGSPKPAAGRHGAGRLARVVRSRVSEAQCVRRRDALHAGRPVLPGAGDVQQHRPDVDGAQLPQRLVRFRGEEAFGSVTAVYIFTALRPERAGYPVSPTHALGFTIPVGENTVRISPVYRHVAGHCDLDSLALGPGYDLNLSKRTTMYARVGYIDNRARATATLGAIPAGSPGEDFSTLAIGVRARF